MIFVTVVRVLLFVLHVCMLRVCEGDGNAGAGDGDVVVASAADVLGMRGVRGMCMCLARDGVGEGVSGLGFRLYQSCGNRGSVGRVSVFGLRRWGGGRGIGPGSEGVVLCLWSPDSLCRWQVHVSVYCAREIPAHLMFTQCSILLHLIDIYFLSCICLWQV